MSIQVKQKEDVQFNWGGLQNGYLDKDFVGMKAYLKENYQNKCGIAPNKSFYVEDLVGSQAHLHFNLPGDDTKKRRYSFEFIDNCLWSLLSVSLCFLI